MDRLSGARLLHLLREMGDTDWSTLCDAVGIDSFIPLGAGFASLPSIFLFSQLQKLSKAGLIVLEKHPAIDPRTKIALTEHLNVLKDALEISLTTVARTTERSSLVVTPVFGRPSRYVVPTDVFVVMPFAENLKPVYDDHIVKASTELGLTVARADDFFSTHAVMHDIWAAMCASRIVIADCTGRNPNVFYEIGLAHVLGKSVVLITQDSSDVPFDLKHFRYLQYEFTPRGMRMFEAALSKTLTGVLKPHVAGEAA